LRYESLVIPRDAWVHAEHDTVQARLWNVRGRHHLQLIKVLRREPLHLNRVASDDAVDHGRLFLHALVDEVPLPSMRVNASATLARLILIGLVEGNLGRLSAGLVVATVYAGDHVHRDAGTAAGAVLQ
jgi:hypothetical protein